MINSPLVFSNMPDHLEKNQGQCQNRYASVVD